MKEKILRTTAKIISEEGLNSASTRAVCRAVGISAPTLYYHFKSKAELVNAVTLFTFETHRKNKQQVRTEDSLSTLRSYWDEYIKFSIEEKDLHRAMILAITQGQMSDVGFSCFNDLVAEFKKLEDLGKLNKPALQCSQIYLGAAQGISIILMGLPKSKSNSLAASTRDIILNGLLKEDNREKPTSLQ